MLSKTEGRPIPNDLIDDIIDPPSLFTSSVLSAKDGVKGLKGRSYSSYTNIPSLFNKSQPDNIENSKVSLGNEFRDRSLLSMNRSNSSYITMTNDDRRKEIDMIIKQLYDGKLQSTSNDEHATSEISETSNHGLSKGPITTTSSTVPATKTDEDTKNHIGMTDCLPLESDITTFQRELQEKELDLIHLHKEIQELQVENKLLKAKVSNVYSNGYASNNPEVDVLRRERDILHNELRLSQELIAKLQQQQQDQRINDLVRSSRVDELSIQQRDAFEKKLRTSEKQIRTLVEDNDKLKQSCQQNERIMEQLKQDNEELKLKIVEASKRTDELFHQEFNALRNDLKILKQRNTDLFEQNLRLQQEKQGLLWQSCCLDHHQQQQQHQNQPTTTSSSQLSSNVSDGDTKSTQIGGDYASNPSETNGPTNTVPTNNNDRSVVARTGASLNRSTTIDEIFPYHRTKRYNTLTGQDELNQNGCFDSLLKPNERLFNTRSLRSQRPFVWNEEKTQVNEETPTDTSVSNTDITNQEDDQQNIDHSKPRSSSQSTRPLFAVNRNVMFKEYHTNSQRQSNTDTNAQQDDSRPVRKSSEQTNVKRPYAPVTISDIHLNDVIKFTRPGGKISKGTVKYIGPLPDKDEQYLGLELENEDSKHDGIYQDKRLFQCKANKGIFIGFNKVIMAWGEK